MENQLLERSNKITDTDFGIRIVRISKVEDLYRMLFQ